GVELLGEYKDSGYSQPPSLVRRPDGQVIQMSALLYRVTSRIDGARDAEAIAGQVSADLGRTLTADQVCYLITAKLEPLGIGAGIYMVWPAFYTNVTDSYRLSRAGRLRTDLGGLYFNAVFMLALAGVYEATSAEILLLVIAFTHLEMLEQLLPFVRFDGYYILSDLAGVPDLFARVVPILKSALPAGRRDPRVA